ncbi:MAG: nucleoside recognition domain-containing protein, partial [Alistipes dispar]
VSAERNIPFEGRLYDVLMRNDDEQAEIAPEEETDEERTLGRKLLASGDFSEAAVLGFLTFILLYIPCIATVVAIGSEAGWRWAAASVIYDTAVAWLMAWAVYHIASLFA